MIGQVTVNICVPGVNCGGNLAQDPIIVNLARDLQMFSASLFDLIGSEFVTLNVTTLSYREQPNTSFLNLA